MTTPLHATHNASHHDDLEVDDLVVSGDTTLAGTLDFTGAAKFAYNYRDSTTFGEIQLEAYNKYSPDTTIDSHIIRLMEAQTFGGYMSFSGIDSNNNTTPTNNMEFGIITGGTENPSMRINVGGADTIEMFKPLAVTGNATVGGTLTVTDAATLGGGEIVNRKVIFFGSDNVTKRYTRNTVTIKKLVLAGTFPTSGGNTIQIRPQHSGLSDTSMIVTLNIWYVLDNASPTSAYRLRNFGNHDMLNDGTIQIAFIDNDRGDAFVIYIEYY
jgi:hypothetical protein